MKPTVLLSVPLVIEKIYKNRIHPRLHGSAIMRSLHRISPVRRSLHRAAGKKLKEVFGGELRILAIAGAALAPDVEQFLREARFPYAIGYGLTETSPMVAGTPPERTRFRSTGPALPGTEIEIRNADASTGEGEIFIRGPMVMKGYYKDPERTAAVLDEQGWFRTGDLGVLDADGYLYIKGRLKNMILGPSGKNIYPEEIEGIINEQDVVVESLVYEEQGRIVARIYLDYEKLDRLFPASSLSEAQIREVHPGAASRTPGYNQLPPSTAQQSAAHRRTARAVREDPDTEDQATPVRILITDERRLARSPHPGGPMRSLSHLHPLLLALVPVSLRAQSTPGRTGDRPAEYPRDHDR